MKSKPLVCCRFYPSCYCSEENHVLGRVVMLLLVLTAAVTVLGLVAGCDPLEGAPERPDPSPSVMYTVIHPEE